ncbi:unnamed protein product [Closterium sp. Yama58-4]|nr:unnamed protein product [Closterium sp. Yama58-4]
MNHGYMRDMHNRNRRIIPASRFTGPPPPRSARSDAAHAKQFTTLVGGVVQRLPNFDTAIFFMNVVNQLLPATSPERPCHDDGSRSVEPWEAHRAEDGEDVEMDDEDGEASSSMESAPSVDSVASDDVTGSDGQRDIRFEIARIARKYFLPNTAITDIIQLFKRGSEGPTEVELWETYRDLERFEEEFLSNGEEWESADIELPGGIGFMTFRYKRLVPIPLRMWEKMSRVAGFTTKPREVKVDNVRRYGAAVECDWFHRATVCEEARWLDGGVEMVALFPTLPSALTSEQKTAAMHEMLGIVLGPLMALSSVASGGIRVTDHLGGKSTVFPLLGKYVCDQPESSMVTCTWAATSNQPCSLCIVSKWDLADLTKAIEPRTVKDQKDVYKRMEKASAKRRNRKWVRTLSCCAAAGEVVVPGEVRRQQKRGEVAGMRGGVG